MGLCIMVPICMPVWLAGVLRMLLGVVIAAAVAYLAAMFMLYTKQRLGAFYFTRL